MQPRDYQFDVCDIVWRHLEKPKSGHPIAVVATGGGKGVIISVLTEQARTRYPGHVARVFIVAPSTELVEQNAMKMAAINPTAPIGILSAGLGRRDYLSPILFATIGTLYRALDEVGAADLLIVDECHSIQPGEAGMYRKVIARLLQWNPSLRVVGFTATPFRGDGVWLTAVENPLFDSIVCNIGIGELLSRGYLAPLFTPSVDRLIDAAKVTITAGDYNLGELAVASDKSAVTERAIDISISMGVDRKAWLAFTVTVEHAKHVSDALNARGINAAVVCAETPAAERRHLVATFRAGRLRCLVTVAALTVGFDAPLVDMIIYLRPTRSPLVYVQSLGRGLRPAPGKADCLVLDFTDTIERLGPIDRITGRDKKSKSKGETPYRICPTCSAKLATSLLLCPGCGHEFPPPERITHGVMASDAAILAGAPKPTVYEITRVAYARHTKPGSPDSLRVDYYSGIRRVVSEWVSLEREGYARTRAESWWRRRCSSEVPETVAEALLLTEGLVVPASVTVNDSERYPEIVAVNWTAESRAAA